MLLGPVLVDGAFAHRLEGALDYGYFGLDEPSAAELERQRRIAAGLD